MADPVKTCRRKWRYRTKQDAKRHIRGGMNKFLHVYHCDECGGYHLGHDRWAPKNNKEVTP
jgi:excinuclease UvrABC ATPase subunit